MTDNLILYELQKIHEAPTKTKEAHTLNFRMIKPTEKVNFSELILITTKLGLIRLSVYNSVFKDNGNNKDILYTFTLTEPQGCTINIKPANVLYQNIRKDGIEYIEFHIKNGHGRPNEFNGDMLGFTLHLI